MRLLIAGALLVAGLSSAALTVPRVPHPAGAACVSATLDSAGVPFDSASYSRWATPAYTPSMRFRIAHTGDAILLQYVVREAGAVASVTDDNGRVFRDACVEFFLSPGANDSYYNFELNCIGSLLLQGGRRGTRRPLATPDIEALVERHTSLGTAPVDFRGDTVEWQASLIIPKEALFLDSISDLGGTTMTANFYKCGGAEPNYLMWRPINTERPQFHRPQDFDTLSFAR